MLDSFGMEDFLDNHNIVLVDMTKLEQLAKDSGIDLESCPLYHNLLHSQTSFDELLQRQETLDDRDN